MGMLAGLLAGPACAAGGLSVPGSDALWPSWQARLMLTAPRGHGLALAPAAQDVRQAALLGDWYLSGNGATRANRWRGGLHATGGLVLGHLGHAAAVSRSSFSVSLMPATDTWPTVGGMGLKPYVGVGYAGTTADGGFSVSADLGLVAGRPGALFGAQSLNETLRQLQLAPMLRLGVNYSF